eukprot:scaffold243294_cov30-Tisochrysis_lutea.AAC.2
MELILIEVAMGERAAFGHNQSDLSTLQPCAPHKKIGACWDAKLSQDERRPSARSKEAGK